MTDFRIYDSIDLARHLMAVCQEKGIKFEKDNGNTKLNKLLYIVYGVYWALYKRPILNEKPRCLPYGPVFIKVYSKYKNLDPIKMYLEDKNLNYVIENVIEMFGNWKAGRLSSWSHQEGSPWSKVKGKDGHEWGNELEDEDIYKYFLNNVLSENARKSIVQ